MPQLVLCAGPEQRMSPTAAAMAATVEPVSSTVVDKVETAAVAAHKEGVSQGMDAELARCCRLLSNCL